MTVNLKILTVQIAGMFVVFALALFLVAGSVVWPRSCTGFRSRSCPWPCHQQHRRHTFRRSQAQQTVADPG